MLDVYRPKSAGPRLPVVLYVHGGGFRILNKDTHWLFPLQFARRGYLAFNINYRLAPKHPYPAAVEDVAEAYAWVTRNAALYGGDPENIIVAGESAGGNLVTGLVVSACYEREEPWAQTVFQTGVVPKACVPFCGMLQVSDVERLTELETTSTFIRDRLLEIVESYLGAAKVPEPAAWDHVDPLCVLERGEKPARPLPPFFIPCGTQDVLLSDSQRLQRALEALGVRADAPEYPGEIHAFMAFIWRGNARRCWRDTFAFLDEVLGRARR